MHTAVVNPPKVSFTDKKFFNDLALSPHFYVFSNAKSMSLIRDDFLSVTCLVYCQNLFHCDKLFGTVPYISSNVLITHC